MKTRSKESKRNKVSRYTNGNRPGVKGIDIQGETSLSGCRFRVLGRVIESESLDH